MVGLPDCYFAGAAGVAGAGTANVKIVRVGFHVQIAHEFSGACAGLPVHNGSFARSGQCVSKEHSITKLVSPSFARAV
jgi:hypothetical protein